MVTPGSVALSTVTTSVLVLKPLLAASAEAEFRVNSVVWLPSLMLSSGAPVRCESERSWVVADLAGVVVRQGYCHVSAGLHTQGNSETVAVTVFVELVVATAGGDDDARDTATVDHADGYTNGSQFTAVVGVS